MKQPRTWLEINKSAFDHNIDCYIRLLGKAMALSVVVKSNGYGHGLQEIGLLCEQNNAVAWLCTAMLSEAIILRQHGIKKPILVLSFIDEDPVAAIEQNIDLVVYDMATLLRLNEIGKMHNRPVMVHVKVDTGMSRFGFALHDAFAAVQAAMQLPFITVRGICTHFADSSNADTSFTRAQAASFSSLLATLKKQNIVIPIRHASNSAGTIISDLGADCTMVRIGAGAYGILPPHQFPCADTSLKSVMTWKTTITGIRMVEEGATIGYGRFFTASRTMRMGFLPIGYFDGYNAGAIAPFYNGMVRVRDQYAPVIGRLCMNVVMIDLTDIASACEGDEVIVMGDYEHIRPYDIAVRTGTHNARVVCSAISPQIPRIIVL